MRPSMYQDAIAEIVPSGIDPRHVEGWMRLEHPTLDHLTVSAFRREALIGVECIREAGVDESEILAQSYGL